MHVQLLGPVSLEADGRPLDVRRTLELALIARLALEPGRVVGTERLVDDLWGERLPSNPAGSLQGLVYRLRQSLDGQGRLLRRSGGGYVLDVGRDDVDSSRFDSLVLRARRDRADLTPSDRRALLQEALEAWKGPALAGLEVPFVDSQRARLEAARLVALQERVEADLACGAHREVIGELEGLVREYPDEERLWGQLMLALYRSGSQGAALRAFDRLRHHLVEALGVNPSASINDLERAILLQDPALAWPSPDQGAAPAVGVGQDAHSAATSGVPASDDIDSLSTRGDQAVRVDSPDPDRTVAELIRAARRTRPTQHLRRTGVLPLVGRDGHLASLTQLIEGAGRDDAAAFVIVEGAPGHGKTRLLEEFATLARSDGRLVVVTSCEDDDVLPYRPFAELVREVLASSGAAACLEQLGPLVSDLAWLVPTSAGPPATHVADVGLARMRLFEAVLGLSQVAASQQELLFLVDEAHRMGLETAALLGLLLDRALDGRLTVVLAARDDAASRSQGLRDLLRRHQPMAVGVGPLSPAEVAELRSRGAGALETGEADEDVETLYAQTGGVPVLLSALLAAQSLAGQKITPAGSERVDLNTLVAARTRQLSPSVQHMLQVAALAGSAVSPDLVADATGGDSRLVRRALDRVVSGGGLLDAGSSDDDYSWRHPLVRQAVIDSLDQPELRRFREAVGDAWAGQGEALRAARQAVEVLAMTTRRLLPVVLSGVDEALQTLAFELAEDLCRQALDLSGRDVDPPAVVGLLNRLGRSLAYRARRADAIDAWEKAAQIARNAGQPELIAQVALATAPYARSTVNFPLRWALLNEVLPNLAALEGPTRVHVISAWIDEGTLNHHATTDPILMDRGLGLAREQGDDTLLATALVAAHNARRATREVPSDVSAELCEVAARMGNPALQTQAHLVALIDAVSLADSDLAECHLGAYLRAVDASPSPRSRWEASMVRSTWALLKGDNEASDHHAQTALQTGQHYGIEDAPLAFTIHLFFRCFHDGTLDRLVHPLTQYSREHPEIPAWRAGAGLAMVAAGDTRGASAVRDDLVPQLLTVAVDPTWPVAACVAAQLCWETAAGEEQTVPLLHALAPYPGRIAVLGRFIGEFGATERYLGLLAALHGDSRAQRWLESAVATSDLVGGRLWAERGRRDLEAIARR